MLPFPGVGKLNTIIAAATANLATILAAIAGRAPAATAVSDADLTPARAALLDKLDALMSSRAPAISPLLSAPKASGIVGSAGTYAGGPLSTVIGAKVTAVTSTSYATIDTYTGAGVLNLAILQKTDTGWDSCSLRVTLDGNVVDTATTGAVQYFGVAVAGCTSTGGITAIDQIPFHASLLIEAKANVAGATAQCYTRYRMTA